MQVFWGKFPAFSLQFMQFDGLPLLIHRCFCVKTAVFITQTKVPQLFDSQGTLCLSVLFLLGGFGGGVAILGTLGRGLGQGGIGVIRRSCIAAVGHVILGIVANGTAT